MTALPDALSFLFAVILRRRQATVLVLVDGMGLDLDFEFSREIGRRLELQGGQRTHRHVDGFTDIGGGLFHAALRPLDLRAYCSYLAAVARPQFRRQPAVGRASCREGVFSTGRSRWARVN